MARAGKRTTEIFFDNLFEQPEHRATIKESGITRALYLKKVIKAPNKELGDTRMYYDLAKKRYQDRENEKNQRVSTKQNAERREIFMTPFDSICRFLERTYDRPGRKRPRYRTT